MDEVKAHELKVSGAVVEGTGVDRCIRARGTAPAKAHDTSKVRRQAEPIRKVEVMAFMTEVGVCRSTSWQSNSVEPDH